MKKRVYGRKFSRGSGARRALIRSLIRGLVTEGSIVTTESKAKTMRRQAEKMVNLAKKGDIHGRRRVHAQLGNDRTVTEGLFNKIAPNFKDRVGGYLRIVKLPKRRGDGARMARVEWVKEISESSVSKRSLRSGDQRKGSKKSIKGKTDKKSATQSTHKSPLKVREKSSEGRKTSAGRTGIRGLIKRRSAKSAKESV
ncbi:MAG: 50S ribosomal protein L17 [Patescibacteria group bacterium]